MDARLERLLGLVKQELGANDARIELGGEPPKDAHLVAAPFGDPSLRVVAVFSAPVAEREAAERRLAALVSGFRDTAEQSAASLAGLSLPENSARTRLDIELTHLATRAGAVRALVFDLSSPVIWGASLLDGGDAAGANRDLHAWVSELRSDRAEELRSAYGHVVRLTLADGAECLARAFAGIYVLSLAFRDALSEPVAVGAMLHAAEAVERLVLALPPIDPEPGGKVIRLPRREGG
ncbi:MAG TPA: hypothetical protein VFZ53_23505 [Polyangiaceae bacterium]